MPFFAEFGTNYIYVLAFPFFPFPYFPLIESAAGKSWTFYIHLHQHNL